MPAKSVWTLLIRKSNFGSVCAEETTSQIGENIEENQKSTDKKDHSDFLERVF